MKRETVAMAVIPYSIYFILFLLERARKWVASSLQTTPYFFIMIFCYMVCGVLIYYFVKTLVKHKSRKRVILVLGIHIVIVITLFVLLFSGWIFMPPIYHFFEISFFLFGIYFIQIINLICKVDQDKLIPEQKEN